MKKIVTIVSFWSLVVILVPQIKASPWLLTDDQRRAYLYYYAPIILQRTAEDNDRKGFDWITNFYFDRNLLFADNAKWATGTNNINSIANGGGENWQLTPTLYCSLIEYGSGSPKQLTLVYHIYHAIDRKTNSGQTKLHDWEQVRIQLSNVFIAPSSSKVENVLIVTRGVYQALTSDKLQFYKTQDAQGATTGNHVLLWQANWDDSANDQLSGHEIHFVYDPLNFNSTDNARITLFDPYPGDGSYHPENHTQVVNFQYLFVPKPSPAAAANHLNALSLDNSTATTLYSGVGPETTVKFQDVKRIQYELQDIADILPTMTGNDPSWTSSKTHTVMNFISPILRDDGSEATAVPPGHLKTFNLTAANDPGNRMGYLGKEWFWGNFQPGYDDSYFPYLGFDLDQYFGHPVNQHDFGYVISDAGSGSWYPAIKLSLDSPEWYKPENGGFDGRWTQLFANSIGKITLTHEQRRAFLYYYAPIILKRAMENNGRKGFDFMTNFYFDDYAAQNNGTASDDNLRNNAVWTSYINNISSGPSWRLNPTVYTSIIEYYKGGQKCMTLIYHPYYSMAGGDNNNYQVHNWDAIRIQLRGLLAPTPGSGEVIESVALAGKGIDQALPGDDVEFPPVFYQTSSGKHLVVWQAQWTNHLYSGAGDSFEEHGIEFADIDLHGLTSSMPATTTIKVPYSLGGGARNFHANSYSVNFHYVYLPKGSAAALDFGAKILDKEVAPQLASGLAPNQVTTFGSSKRISYELQDIADILPTMVENYDWKTKDLTVENFNQPLEDENGAVVLSAGEKQFYVEARNDPGNREGYIAKNWFWGSSLRIGKDGYGIRNKIDQHDFRPLGEMNADGTWPDPVSLPDHWYSSEGSYDGRWSQLFDDFDPLTAAIFGTSYVNKGSSALWSANVNGGNGVNTYVWKKNGTDVGHNPTLTLTVTSNFTLSLTVTNLGKTVTTSRQITTGTGIPLAKTNDVEIPESYELLQNFPNPFNPSTSIRFGLPEASAVTLKIYNINGQLVRTLFGGMMTAGFHTMQWDSKDDNGHVVASGIYVYRLESGQFIESRKLILIK